MNAGSSGLEIFLTSVPRRSTIERRNLVSVSIVDNSSFLNMGQSEEPFVVTTAPRNMGRCVNVNKGYRRYVDGWTIEYPRRYIKGCPVRGFQRTIDIGKIWLVIH
jgi:hypothetical protein